MASANGPGISWLLTGTAVRLSKMVKELPLGPIGENDGRTESDAKTDFPFSS